MTRSEWETACRSVVGARYVYGGESPEEGGYDCTGLLHRVAGRLLGRSVPRESVRGLWDRLGAGAAEAPDVDVCLALLDDGRGRGVPHHALLRLRCSDGDPLWLHASSGRGKVVLDSTGPRGKMWHYRLTEVYDGA